jgi:hypothetical protein
LAKQLTSCLSRYRVLPPPLSAYVVEYLPTMYMFAGGAAGLVEVSVLGELKVSGDGVLELLCELAIAKTTMAMIASNTKASTT